MNTGVMRGVMRIGDGAPTDLWSNQTLTAKDWILDDGSCVEESKLRESGIVGEKSTVIKSDLSDTMVSNGAKIIGTEASFSAFGSFSRSQSSHVVRSHIGAEATIVRCDLTNTVVGAASYVEGLNATDSSIGPNCVIKGVNAINGITVPGCVRIDGGGIVDEIVHVSSFSGPGVWRDITTLYCVETGGLISAWIWYDEDKDAVRIAPENITAENLTKILSQAKVTTNQDIGAIAEWIVDEYGAVQDANSSDIFDAIDTIDTING